MEMDKPDKTARRLLAKLKREEEQEEDEDGRDEAQRLLLDRHLERLRRKTERL
jgi:hypothetical protein